MGPRGKVSRDKADERQGYKNPALRRRPSRRHLRQPLSLFAAAAWALAVLSVLAIALWFSLAQRLANVPPWELPDTETTEYSVLRMVLFIIAGVVGVIGIVVAYRRQQDREQGRFLERLADSAQLLGDDNPTVQAAGIYALAGLADAEGHAHRQQCIDVLCAYIRLPYTPTSEEAEIGALTNMVRKRTLRTRTGPVEEERTITFRPHDRQTRETIVRVITQHLQKDAKVSWSDLDFDFFGAVFDYGDFSDAVFKGTVNFAEVHFAGKFITFMGATFSAGVVSFIGARFTGGLGLFSHSHFAGGKVRFDRAIFSGRSVSFSGARFTGGTVRFEGTKFEGNGVSFDKAQFKGGEVNFHGTDLGGHRHTFMDAEVNGGSISFKHTRVNSGRLEFRRTKFLDGEVNFYGARFNGGSVEFIEGEFSGAVVDLRKAQFAGGYVRFFEPSIWDFPPLVPWGSVEEMPAGVVPMQWPPPLGHRRTYSRSR